MLSVRPSRCHSDAVCFSQVLLGNHSSPKLACLGVSHRTHPSSCLPRPRRASSLPACLSFPFLGFFFLFCFVFLCSHPLPLNTALARSGCSRPTCFDPSGTGGKGWGGLETKIGTFRVWGFKHIRAGTARHTQDQTPFDLCFLALT